MKSGVRKDDGEGVFSLSGIEGLKRKEAYSRRIRKIEIIIASILLASFAVFLVIAAFAIQRDGMAKFIQGLESINLYYFAAALVVIFMGYVMRFPKWEYYLKRLKVSIPRKENFMIYLSMYSMDMTPGRWGRAVVAYTINRRTGVKFARTFPAIVADIFTDFLGFAVILAVSTLMVHRFVLISTVITILLLVPFFFIYVRRPFEFIKRKFGHIRRLKSIFDTGKLYFEYHKLLSRNAYAYSMVYTVPAMFMNGLALYLVILSFGVPMPISFLPTVLFIFTSSLILGMISGLPATLGITDAALVGYLTLFFPNLIDIGLASLITIFFRIASVWFVEGFGMSALLYTMRYWKRGG